MNCAYPVYFTMVRGRPMLGWMMMRSLLIRMGLIRIRVSVSIFAVIVLILSSFIINIFFGRWMRFIVSD
jgi:hypothetical protein